MTDRFVVGTGRCGSTLLTRMLDQHRSTLGLNEVFTGLDWDRRFTTDPVSGPDVAEVLGTPNHVVDLVIGKGYDAEEVTYRFAPGDRYRRGEPIPWILTSTLGHLAESPDALWDETQAWLATRAAMPIADHYRALFAWLAAREGKPDWVERSGSSVDYVDDLVATFDEARIVHLHRDGAEVALSMRRHPFFRLAVQLNYGVMPDGVDPDDEDAVVTAWLEGDPPVEVFGQYWSDQLAHGEATLRGLAPDRGAHVAFEDLVAAPVDQLGRIASFLDLREDPGFAARGAALVDRLPPSRADDLDGAARERLDAACAPGRAVLERLGVTLR